MVLVDVDLVNVSKAMVVGDRSTSGGAFDLAVAKDCEAHAQTLSPGLPDFQQPKYHPRYFATQSVVPFGWLNIQAALAHCFQFFSSLLIVALHSSTVSLDESRSIASEK